MCNLLCFLLSLYVKMRFISYIFICELNVTDCDRYFNFVLSVPLFKSSQRVMRHSDSMQNKDISTIIIIIKYEI